MVDFKLLMPEVFIVRNANSKIETFLIKLIINYLVFLEQLYLFSRGQLDNYK